MLVEYLVYVLVCKLGEELVCYDLMVIIGVGGGIMVVVYEGVGLENSLGFNIILFFEQYVNYMVDGSGNLLLFYFFFLCKLFFVKEVDVLVFCFGGFGILDEVLEVLILVQIGKSLLVLIVLFDQLGGCYWEYVLEFMQEQLLENYYILLVDMCLMCLVYLVEDVVKEIVQFYCNFYFSCWLKGIFVICLNYVLNEVVLVYLYEYFVSFCLSGGFQQQVYSEQEQDELEFCNLICFVFVFNGCDQGWLWELLDYINLLENWD